MSATNTEPSAGGLGGDMSGLVTRHTLRGSDWPWGQAPGEKKACWEFGSQPPESGGEQSRVQALWPAPRALVYSPRK